MLNALIAARIDRNGAEITPAQRQSVAASLAVGHSMPVQVHAVSGLYCAATGQSRGWVPARRGTGALVLFSGYIDNRTALQNDLGRRFADDAALYAAALDAWDDGADLRLIGSFASMVIDPRSQEMRLARSPIAAPPLHYFSDARRMVAASTPRAIFAAGDIDQLIDEQKVADSMLLNYAESQRGWFQGVYRVPVGGRVRITPDGTKTEVYYNFDNLPQVRHARDLDYVEAANHLFRGAVEAALSGFRQPGISVSGGWDSQAVAAFTVEARPDTPLYGFTGVPQAGWTEMAGINGFGNERPHVEALAAMHPRLIPEWVDATGLSFDHRLQGMFLLGSVAPRNAMNLHWIHEVHARAKARGCDVLLTGAFGNATFSFAGTGMVADLFRQGRWLKAAREVWAGRGTRSFARAFTAEALLPHAPNLVWKASRRLIDGRKPDVFEEWCPMTREYARDMRVFERAAEMGIDTDYAPKRSTRDWRRAVLGNSTNESGDIHLAFDLMHGLPTRDPTSHRPLVEFCLGIPDDQFQRAGKRRWLARRMMQGRVPDMVLNETRKGYQAADWYERLFAQRDALLAEIDLLSEDPKMRDRLDLPGLRKVVAEMTPERPKDKKIRARIQLAVSRGLSTARFIRFVEGTNR